MFDHIDCRIQQKGGVLLLKKREKLVTYGLFCGATYLYLQFNQSISCKYYVLLIFITTVTQEGELCLFLIL